MNLALVAKKEVEVAKGMVIPPVESIKKAVVVAPEEGAATTWKRFRFESEEVALSVRTESGEVVPIPTRVAPAVKIASVSVVEVAHLLEALPPLASVPQMTLPEPSVSKASVQVSRV